MLLISYLQPIVPIHFSMAQTGGVQNLNILLQEFQIGIYVNVLSLLIGLAKVDPTLCNDIGMQSACLHIFLLDLCQWFIPYI